MSDDQDRGSSPFDADATASEAVLTAVADRADAALTDLPPLYDAVDPDALDALFGDGRPGRVSFEYAGFEVTVCGRDRVAVVLGEPQSGNDGGASDSGQDPGG